ncbi:histidine phosphatase family protein [Pelagibius litoralis]|uniref:Histidine phosphatase family protein n=1 Tax=Pelagibius litoralis TaxID=374515 RepID=A0A967F2E6_9PROT|nr:histidine phosphatase family protein [Pelagibius litoralis]NIA71665.1 histidine phosphatase family protein [Pelagibius litoralis]
MTALLLIRHGPTAWNEEGRLQGRSDQPLSAQGRREVQGWRVPEADSRAAWITSPLMRARQTAEILHGTAVESEDRLIETDWGDWEGCRLAELRATQGVAMAENEARGLDFQPPGGESPRAVQARVKPLLSALARDRQDTVAVAHKGVIRAVYALASRWDMREKPPVRLERACAHRFDLAPDGAPQVAMLNIPLSPV